jgi:hypothetical protein
MSKETSVNNTKSMQLIIPLKIYANSILTYAQASLVMLPPLIMPFGAVRLLLGFTLTSSKGMFRV